MAADCYFVAPRAYNPPKAGKERRTCMLPVFDVLDKVLSDHALIWTASVTSTSLVHHSDQLSTLSHGAHDIADEFGSIILYYGQQ